MQNAVQTYYQKTLVTGSEEDIRAIIAPHAGYIYSGQTAAYAYRNIRDKKTVLILAPSHYFYFRGASIANVTHYKTPLGTIRLSSLTDSIRKDMDKAGLLYTGENTHDKEHSIEVQLPYLQESLKDFELIPILIGGATGKDDIKKIAEILTAYTDDDTLIIASSDFTHYGPRYGYVPFSETIEDNIRKLDYEAFGYIEKIDTEGFLKYIEETGSTICGNRPIAILLEMIKGTGLKGRLLNYDTSGHISGDYENSVSYASYVFYKDESLDPEEQKYLTALARATIDSYLKDKKILKIDADTLPKKLTEKKGCFVTLTKAGELRGCIGHIFPQKPLYECVIENAVSAATSDPRFSPVTYDELDDIHIEVSVLSVPKLLEFSSPDDLLSRLTPLRDGVVITYGFNKATYLPQVWEQLQDKEQFMESLCQKGGSSSDCWKKSSVKIETYQAQVFGE
ncbi:MAG: AmmeMemoRadiSam system protein B [archaeon]